MNTERDVKSVCKQLIIEIPKDGFDERAIENLRKIVFGKSNLIMKAINAPELPVIVTDDTIRFPWFSSGASSEEIQVYTQFICALAKRAKEHRHIYTSTSDITNECYNFRCFLMRLGFIGAQYKTARRILLKNLSGNSAFKNGSNMKTTEDSNR